MMNHQVYFVVIGLLLTAIAIKYEGSNTNPFKQLTPTTLFFYTTAFSHALAFTADMNLPITKIIVHVSGLLGCEALFWILVAELLWFCLINLFLLLVASLCFFHHIADIIHRLRDIIHRLRGDDTPPSGGDTPPSMQPQEAQVFEYLIKRFALLSVPHARDHDLHQDPPLPEM